MEFEVWRKLRRFTFSISLLCLLAEPALAECEVRRADSPAMGIERLFELMAAASIGSPNDDPRVNNTGMVEEGPESVWLDGLYLAERSDLAFQVVRFGRPGTPTEVEMPEGRLATAIENWTCLLAPGDQVYLSDGFTDHSTMIYRIDSAAAEVTFIDPRAEEVFLLSENTVLEDLGGRWWTEENRKLFAIPFSSMQVVLKLAQLSANRTVMAAQEAAQALAPEIPPTLVNYWGHARHFAMVDIRRAGGASFGYFFDLPEDSPDRALVINYLRALSHLTERMYGSGGASVEPGFEEAIQEFPHYISKNMNFRIVIDLMFAGDYDIAARQAERYMQARGWDLDFAVLLAAACRELGDEPCRTDYDGNARAELDERLSKMFHCTAPPECREMLATSRHRNTTQSLMRHRYGWLD
jgi:hypothetical protein